MSFNLIIWPSFRLFILLFIDCSLIFFCLKISLSISLLHLQYLPQINMVPVVYSWNFLKSWDFPVLWDELCIYQTVHVPSNQSTKEYSQFIYKLQIQYWVSKRRYCFCFKICCVCDRHIIHGNEKFLPPVKCLENKSVQK